MGGLEASGMSNSNNHANPMQASQFNQLENLNQVFWMFNSRNHILNLPQSMQRITKLPTPQPQLLQEILLNKNKIAAPSPAPQAQATQSQNQVQSNPNAQALSLSSGSDFGMTTAPTSAAASQKDIRLTYETRIKDLFTVVCPNEYEKLLTDEQFSFLRNRTNFKNTYINKIHKLINEGPSSSEGEKLR
jgi:hypothetical protein